MSVHSMRAGDADRQAVIDQLSQAFVDGRLGYEEFHDRQSRALEAVTFGDLAPLVQDLPDTSRAPTSLAPTERLALSAGVSTQRRLGVWQVSRLIELTPAAADIKLDFRHARCTSEQVDLVIHGGLGNVILIVSPDWAVDVDRIRSGWGSIRFRAKSSVPGANADQRHRIVVSGGVGMGTLVVRGPRFWDRQP